MPNHVTHKVIVSGDRAEVDRFKTLCIRAPEAGESPTFDFNALIPMPEILLGTERGSNTNLGYEALTGSKWPGMFASSYLTYQWIKDKGITTHAEMKAWCEKEKPEAIEAGRRAIAAIKETGHPSWYEWRCAKWGTKWGAYSFNKIADAPGRFEFSFDTAWSTPGPIWDRLAEEFPTLTFDIVGFDEGWNFAVTGGIEDGVNNVEVGDATDDLYERVYGGAPYREEEEEGAS